MLITTFAQTGVPPEIVDWTQLGIVGVVLGAFFTGLVVAKSTHERQIKQYDDLHARVLEQDKYLREVVIPAFSKNTDVLQQVNTILQQVLGILSDTWRRRDA